MSEEIKTTGEYWIPAAALPPLETKIKRLQKRAAKLDAPPIAFEITGDKETREIGRRATGEWKDMKPVFVPIFREYAKVIVRGEPPKFNGWSLIARLIHPGGAAENNPTDSNIINAVPGKTCPKEFRTAGPNCDHCKAYRMRRDTYIVASDAGEFKQVGSTCIADFLGHQNPEQIAAIYELWADISKNFEIGDDFDGDDFEGGFMRGVNLISKMSLLNLVAAHTRIFGWTSKSAAEKAMKSPSIEAVKYAMFGSGEGAIELRKKLEATPDDIELAGKAVEWAKNLPSDADSDYLYNLRALAAADFVNSRTIGMTASMIGAYRRAIETVNKEKFSRETTNHVGAVGEKLTIDVNVIAVRSFEGYYGARHMNRFADEDGNTIIWWTGTKTFNEGEKIRIAGTVKKHDEYKGFKQTVLTRVKELPSDEQAAILKTISPNAQTILTGAEKGESPIWKWGIGGYLTDTITADEYAAAVAELADRGWIETDDKGAFWKIDDATARLASFAKATKSKAAKKAAKELANAAKTENP